MGKYREVVGNKQQKIIVRILIVGISLLIFYQEYQNHYEYFNYPNITLTGKVVDAKYRCKLPLIRTVS